MEGSVCHGAPGADFIWDDLWWFDGTTPANLPGKDLTSRVTSGTWYPLQLSLAPSGPVGLVTGCTEPPKDFQPADRTGRDFCRVGMAAPQAIEEKGGGSSGGSWPIVELLGTTGFVQRNASWVELDLHMIMIISCPLAILGAKLAQRN